VNDRDAVVATPLDYVNGCYDADLARMEPVLHPQLVKRSAVEVGGDSVTTKERLLERVRWRGGFEGKSNDPIEVTVMDIHHDIAASVVRSAQSREYPQLLRTPDGWRIVTAFWLTDPYQEARG
jgi:hypothetical protein